MLIERIYEHFIIPKTSLLRYGLNASWKFTINIEISLSLNYAIVQLHYDRQEQMFSLRLLAIQQHQQRQQQRQQQQ